MKRTKLIVVLVALLLSMVLILQNTQPVTIRFLLVSLTMPNAVILGLTLLLGVVIGILVALISSSKRKVLKP